MILLITPKEGQDETEEVSLLPNLFYAGSEGKRAAEDVWPPFLQKSSQSREQSPVEAAKSCCRKDYPRVKEWLDQHPGYLKRYRQSRPQYVQKHRQAQRLRDRRKKLHLDIQAQIKDQLPEITEQLWNLPHLDIQDEIPLKPLAMTFLFSTFPCLDI